MSASVTAELNEQQGGAAAAGPRAPRRPPRREASAEEKRDLIFQIKQQYPLTDVLARFGVRMTKRGEWLEGNCPFPNHSDASPSFKVRLRAPGRFHCFGCAASGDIFVLARDLHGLETFPKQVLFLTGRSWADWIEGLPETEEARARQAREFEAVRTRMDAERRAEEARWRAAPDEEAGPVYEGLIKRLRLEERERAEMASRGMDPAIAFECGYRSLPASRTERVRICQALVRAGHCLERVPGFFRLPRRKGSGETGPWCLGGNPWGWREYRERGSTRGWAVGGLLVPLCDALGRIVQLKVRNGDRPPDLPTEFHRFWPPKYMVLGSEKRAGGASPPVKAHHAGPRDGGLFPGVLWVTEGEIKADIGALYLHARFCGLPGVGQCPQLALDAAQQGGFHEVRIAMDAEPDKGHVQAAIARLCREAEARSLRATVAVWDGTARWRRGTTKGIDDLVAAGDVPEILLHAAWWARVPEQMREYVEHRLAGWCVG